MECDSNSEGTTQSTEDDDTEEDEGGYHGAYRFP